MIVQLPLGSKVYVSGPITGQLDNNRKAFNDTARALKAMGYKAINPIALDKLTRKKMEWSDYLRRDIPHLLKCDGVVFLKGWETSRGARLEWRIALDLGLIIYFWEWRHNTNDKFGKSTNTCS